MSARPANDQERAVIVKAIERSRQTLYTNQTPGQSLSAVLLHKEDAKGETASNQGVNKGLRSRPFDFTQVKLLQLANEHHANCIHTKVAATVGLGFLSDKERQIRADKAAGKMTTAQIGADWKQSKVDEVLNPLCDHSWQDTLNAIAEDYWEVGNGYLEVVRGGEGKISGLHHIMSNEVWICVEDDLFNFHYEIQSGEGAGGNRIFAAFGDKEELKVRLTTKTAGTSVGMSDEAKDRISEVIHFRRPTGLDKWYGYPDWISCVAAIELIQCLRQYKYDFFNNRGVPEFLLFVMGQKLEEEEWKKITDALEANIGRGASHKSVALNIPNEQIKIELHKLAMEGGNDDTIDKSNETYQMAIVSAHGVPPLLAGIMIPGKLGASNELPNAIRAFQTLKIGQTQRLFQQRLGTTLGGKDTSLGLTMDDFTFRTITDAIDLDQMDTSTRMRQTEGQAAAQGRDLKAGVKD
jgi:capsid portal protein